MKSSFTNKPLLVIIGIVIVSCITIGVSIYSVNPLNHVSLLTSITGIILLVLFILWLIIIVLGTKAIEITILNGSIEVKQFIGFGKTNTYLFSTFDGYKIDTFSFRQDHYERLCFIKNEKKLFEISSYFHEDYFGLKAAVASKLNRLL